MSRSSLPLRTVFIREHLSPQYSQLSKPLRDVLITLQENRRKGYKSRAQPMKPPPDAGKVESGEGAWPSFWSEACKQAFSTLKRLATHPVDLQVPDFKGAERGDNLFHILPDACAYGVGGGYARDTPRTPPRHPLTTPRSVYRLGLVRPRSLLSLASSRGHHAVIAALTWKP